MRKVIDAHESRQLRRLLVINNYDTITNKEITCRDRTKAAQLVEDYDDPLFSHLMNSEQHMLHHLIPAQTQSNQHYNLRPRPHNLSLSYAMDHRNFIPRLAFKDTY